MSFKYFIPKTRENLWETYWDKADIEKEIESCENDELLLIIEKHVHLTDKIIDAGCGFGRWVVFLSKKGYNIFGVDSFKNVITKIREIDPSLKLMVADVKHLPFNHEEFNVYLSFGVVEHFEEGPQMALAEAKRVLRKGGVIILETPHDNYLRKTKRFLGFLKRKIFKNNKGSIVDLQFYEYRFSAGELTRFLKDLNFKIVSIYPKDLVGNNESIGLWSEIPFLRLSNEKPFQLNMIGRLLKIVFKPFKFLFSGCIVVVAKK